MAKKTADISYRDLVADIRAKRFAPVYILMGNEPYYIDKVVELLESNVVAPDDRDFNQIIYYGADADLDMVAAACTQYPVMAERKLVVLKEAQTLLQAKTSLEKLAGYVGRPSSTTVFVIAFKGDTLNATSELLKSAAQSESAVVFKSMEVSEYNLPGPIKDYSAEKGISLDDGAVALLIESLGSSLEKIFGEIDKLIISAPPGVKRFSREMVEKNIGLSKEFKAYELTDAIGRRNYKKAMTIVETYRKSPKQYPVVVVNATLFNYFAKIVIVALLKDKSDASMMKALNVKSSYSLKKVKEGLKNYPGMKSILAISELRNLDCRIKGIDSMQNEHDLLKETVYRLFTL